MRGGGSVGGGGAGRGGGGIGRERYPLVDSGPENWQEHREHGVKI